MKREERHYWRSLDELEQTPAFQAALEREFPEEIEAGTLDGATRRHFLSVMGASVAMTSLAGCVRRPVQHIVPYGRQPEDVLPGVAQRYATATHIGPNVIGLLAESHEGRPTKLEGNPDHKSSRGATAAIHQAMVLDLYDPMRLASPRKGNVPTEWDAVDSFFKDHFTALRDQKSGQGLAILSESIPSPTYDALRRRIRATYPGARWFTYEPVSEDNQRAGLMAAFGAPLRPSYRLNRAKVVVALDSDFLGTEGDVVAQGADWAALRRIDETGGDLSRLYAVEGRYSITGTNADHRLRIAPSQVSAVAFALAKGFAEKGAAVPADILSVAAERSAGLDAKAQKFVAAMVDDLWDRRLPNGVERHGLVLVGRNQPPVVHAIAAALNHALSVQGVTLYYFPDIGRGADEPGDMESIAALAAELNAGKVDTLLMIGSNPVYSAPGDLDFAGALAKAKTTISLAEHLDETARLCTWAVPKLHFLEAWGDLAATDGTVSIVQPLVEPLHGGWSAVETVARVLLDEPIDGYTLVRDFQKGAQRKRLGRSDAGFHKQWRRWLHDGVTGSTFIGTHPTHVAPRGAGRALDTKPLPAPDDRSLEVVFHEDPNLWDGRFGTNSWLQEAPEPITKITWDNAALFSPATAKALHIDAEQMVSIEVDGRKIECVAWLQPGQADGVVALTLGYGRDFGNFLPYHPTGKVGFDVGPLRSTAAAFIVAGARVGRLTARYLVASVQRYGAVEGYGGPDQERRGGFGSQSPGFGFEGRPVVRVASLDEYRAKPTFAKSGVIEHGAPPPEAPVLHPPLLTLYEDSTPVDYSKGWQWGLSIDLNTCTGCNACVVACVAENNVMAVGKDQVRRGRELHWIRMDRYFVGDSAEPEVVHQPMGCQHCETAPCENVCPVAATTHSPEGLNDMAYNRCIGTRYCANNCPFKVRRFNFYNYSKGQPELIHMVRNPNVTVRFRGVMEKCTYCVQRINAGRREAKQATDEAGSRAAINAIRTACQQTCPTGAIVFGDINDKESAVAKLKAQDRDYHLLDELNVRPRTSYLAKVRNPNPKLVG